MSRCGMENVPSSSAAEKLDLELFKSKDDWNLEQLLFDENFLAENSVQTDVQKPESFFGMGADDYRNATNPDFIIPGLPSLQPNLDDIGVVDFDGDVMFNSNVFSSQLTIQQLTSHAQPPGKPEITSNTEQNSASNSQLSRIPPAMSVLDQYQQQVPSSNNCSDILINQNVTDPAQLQLVTSKHGKNIHSEVNLNLVQGHDTNP